MAEGSHSRRFAWFAAAALGLGQCLLPGYSQSPTLDREFVIRNWTKDHGLPVNKIEAMLQDRNGYLWVATHFGAARFDGLRWISFNMGTRSDMPDDRMPSVAEDSAGGIWFGSSKGALRWDGQRFGRVGEEHGLFSDHADTVVSDTQGGIWVVAGTSVQRINTETMRADPPIDFKEWVAGLTPDSSGWLWAGGTQVRRWNPLTGEVVVVPVAVDGSRMDVRVPSHESGSPAYVICQGSDGSRRLITLAPGSPPLVSSLPPHNSGRAEWMVAGERGALYLGNGVAGGIGRWQYGEFEALGKPWNVKDDVSTCAIRDREGSLWIGTENSGVFRLTPRRIAMVTPADGLAHPNVRCVWPARDGGIWASTDGGLSRIPAGLRPVQSWTRMNGGPLDWLKAVAERPDGGLWFGTAGGPVEFRDGQFTVHRFSAPERELRFDRDAVAFNKVRCILPARDGSLWISVQRALHRMHNGLDQVFSVTNGLGGEDVRVLLETRDGTIWAGAQEGGLSRFTGEPGRSFETLTRKDGLSRDTVWSLAEDSSGALWIGTDGGLNRLQNGRIDVLDLRHGLPAADVNCLLVDDENHLWVGHDRGIYRASLESLHAAADGRRDPVDCFRLEADDGLLIPETNGRTITPAACRTADGRLWFATPKGIAVINPAALWARVPPPVVIELVTADQRELPLTRAGQLNAPFPSASSVHQIAAGQGRVLEFAYTATTFLAPEKTRFRYRLGGFEEHWHEAGNRRFAQYIGLPPGRYQFQVLAANHHAVWNETGAAFDFVLQPFYWQTRWFWGGVSVCGIATIGSLVKLRERRLRRVEALKRQAAQATLRAQMAADLHDGLGSNLARLNLLADGLGGKAQVPAVLEAEVRSMAFAARELARTVRDIMWNANPGDASLDGLVAQIAENAHETLTTAGILCRLELPDRLPATRLSAEQRSGLFFAAKEAITNIVRHAHASSGEVSVEAKDGQLVVQFADNGVGFDTEAKGDSATNPGRSQETVGIPPRGFSTRGGNGLPSIRSRIESLGGQCVLQSQPGLGTRLRFEIPLANLGETVE